MVSVADDSATARTANDNGITSVTISGADLDDVASSLDTNAFNVTSAMDFLNVLLLIAERDPVQTSRAGS